MRKVFAIIFMVWAVTVTGNACALICYGSSATRAQLLRLDVSTIVASSTKGGVKIILLFTVLFLCLWN